MHGGVSGRHVQSELMTEKFRLVAILLDVTSGHGQRRNCQVSLDFSVIVVGLFFGAAVSIIGRS